MVSGSDGVGILPPPSGRGDLYCRRHGSIKISADAPRPDNTAAIRTEQTDARAGLTARAPGLATTSARGGPRWDDGYQTSSYPSGGGPDWSHVHPVAGAWAAQHQPAVHQRRHPGGRRQCGGPAAHGAGLRDTAVAGAHGVRSQESEEAAWRASATGGTPAWSRIGACRVPSCRTGSAARAPGG